jgi:hypothetical protein
MVNTEYEDYEDDYDDTEVEDIDCGAEIIDWWSYAADNYRITADAANARTAAEPRWVVARCWQRGDEYVYDPITEPVTLDEAEDQSELADLIAQAEDEPDLVKRMEIIDQMGEKIRVQIAAAKSGN